MEGNILEEIEVLEDETNEEIEEVLQETVSMGDSYTGADATALYNAFSVEDITEVVEASTLTSEEIIEAIEAAEIIVTVSSSDTIFTKPLEDYTVTEGLLLILVLCAVGLVIDKVIGGILNCKWLLKK